MPPAQQQYSRLAVEEDNDDDVRSSCSSSPDDSSDDDTQGDGSVFNADSPVSDITAPSITEEVLPMLKLAGPMSVSQLVHGFTQQVSIMMLGHLGPEKLAAAVLATMFCNITGVSVVLGGMSGVNTFMSQSFGAGNYPRIGHLLQRAIAICTCLMLPISLLWVFGTGPALRWIGVEAGTSQLSQDFARVYLAYLWPMLTTQCIQCFLRSQGIVHPITILSFVGTGFNVPTMYFSISKFGFIGGPLGQVFGAWLLLVLYLLYFCCTGVHMRCWHGWSAEGLREWQPLVKLGAGGTLSMVGLWWSWEIFFGIVGRLGTIPLAAHSCATNISFFYFSFISATTMSCSIRTAQHLGAGRTQHAICSAQVPYYVLAPLMCVIWIVLMSLRSRFAYLYTDEPQIVELAASILPIYLTYITLTAANFCFKARLDACGHQSKFAKVAMFSWYLVGIPCAAVGALLLQLGLESVWGGMVTGSLVSLCGMARAGLRLDWAAETQKALVAARRKKIATAAVLSKPGMSRRYRDHEMVGSPPRAASQAAVVAMEAVMVHQHSTPRGGHHQVQTDVEVDTMVS